MSKNFELLQKLGKEKEFLGSVPAGHNHNGTMPTGAPSSGAVAPDPLAQPGLEGINAVAQQVFIIPGADAPRTVVFASTEPGTGCTWVCAHVGEVLAGRVAGSVCLVDANLRDPGLDRHFGLEDEIGLSDALLRQDPIRSFVRPLHLPNLWLIGCGSAGGAAESALASDRMRLRITELRSEFDFVLIDASAMSVSNDAIGLGSIADGVVMVLKANASRRQVARQAIQDLQGGKAKVLGVVLNQRTFPIPDSIYNKL